MVFNGRPFTALAVAVILLAFAGTAFASTAQQAGARSIVVFQKGFVDQDQKDSIIKKAGMKKIKNLNIINAVVVEREGGASALTEGLNGVLRMENDAVIHLQGKLKGHPQKESDEVLPWGVDRIDANDVWDRNHDLDVDGQRWAGSGVKVALLDTGVEMNHPDLRKNIKKGYNVVDPKKPPYDALGHGTHVAGTLAAVDNRAGVLGTAPKALIYPVKVMDDEGYGTVSGVIEALEWCIENRMQVVNMSFGTYEDVQSLHDAIAEAYDSGIVLVAAVGNDGPGNDTVEYPARYTEVIAVSATDSTDTVTEWSSSGPEVEIAAPGADILSTFLDGEYIAGYGTSMAAPHVSGTAALIISSGIKDKNKDGRINSEVREALRESATDLGDPGRDSLYGHGLLNAKGAVGRPGHNER
ncbi:MAG TPA: peptidase S8 [Desulfotomaculum sp.]|nr:peptidase S8 [Desulfotomaculum sp.]